MSVLDLSQQHLYRFFFDVMKPQHGDNIRMVTADTDSFYFILELMIETNDKMDFSGYDKNINAMMQEIVKCLEASRPR